MIITFYSYKGGVGRSMALANIGAVMAQSGYNVLMLDWDFEAPGLAYYFTNYIDTSSIDSKWGIIDILHGHFQEKQDKIKWQDCVVEINLDKTITTGHLSLITTGKKTEDYFRKVKSFDYKNFYTKKSGGSFIEQLRKDWNEKYDFILVDSRTGISDTGGICTVQLPDILVEVFTATQQGLEGIIQVGTNVNKSLSKLPIERYSIMVLPILTRFEIDDERTKGINWLKNNIPRLKPLVKDWFPEDKLTDENLIKFYEDNHIGQSAYFSFDETLPVFENTKEEGGIAHKYIKFAALLCRSLNEVDQFINDNVNYVKKSSKEEREKESLTELKKYILARNSIAEVIRNENNPKKEALLALTFDDYFILPKFHEIRQVPEGQSEKKIYKGSIGNPISTKITAGQIVGGKNVEKRSDESESGKEDSTHPNANHYLSNCISKFTNKRVIILGETQNGIEYLGKYISYLASQKQSSMEGNLLNNSTIDAFRKTLPEEINKVFLCRCQDLLGTKSDIYTLFSSYLSTIEFYDNLVPSALLRQYNDEGITDSWFIFEGFEELDKPSQDAFVTNLNNIFHNDNYGAIILISKLPGEPLIPGFSLLELDEPQQIDKENLINEYVSKNKKTVGEQGLLFTNHHLLKGNTPKAVYKYFTDIVLVNDEKKYFNLIETEIGNTISKNGKVRNVKTLKEFAAWIAFKFTESDKYTFSIDDIAGEFDKFVKVYDVKEDKNQIIDHLFDTHIISKSDDHSGKISKDEHYVFSDKRFQDYLAGFAISKLPYLRGQSDITEFILQLLNETEKQEANISSKSFQFLKINKKWATIICHALSSLQEEVNIVLPKIIGKIKHNESDIFKAQVNLLVLAVEGYLPKLEVEIARELISYYISNLTVYVDIQSLYANNTTSDEVDEVLRNSSQWNAYYKKQLLLAINKENLESINNSNARLKLLSDSLCKLFNTRYPSKQDLENYYSRFDLDDARPIDLLEFCILTLNTAFNEATKAMDEKLLLTPAMLDKYKLIDKLFALLNTSNDAVSTLAAWTLGWLSAARDEDSFGIWEINESQVVEVTRLITQNNSRISGYATWWLLHVFTKGFQKWYYPHSGNDPIYDWAVQLDNKIKELETDLKITSPVDAVIKNKSNFCYQVMGKDTTGKTAWYFVLVDRDKKTDFLNHKQGDNYDLADFGRIIASGYGIAVPDDVQQMLREKYDFDNF